MNVRLKPPQFKVFRCAERFRVLVAGRRFGKTYLALVELAGWRFRKIKRQRHGTSLRPIDKQSASLGKPSSR